MSYCVQTVLSLMLAVGLYLVWYAPILVDTRLAGEGTVTVSVADGHIPCSLNEVQTNQYRATFKAAIPGLHNVKVKFNDYNVKGNRGSRIFRLLFQLPVLRCLFLIVVCCSTVCCSTVCCSSVCCSTVCCSTVCCSTVCCFNVSCALFQIRRLNAWSRLLHLL